MRLLGIVMFEPDFQFLRDCFRFRQDGELGVLPFGGVDEALGHSSDQRTFYGYCDGLESRFSCKLAGVRGGLARAIGRQSFNFGCRRFSGTDAIFNNLQHKIPHEIGVDSLRRCNASHELPFTTNQGKGDAIPFAVVAGDFESVRTPVPVALFGLRRRCLHDAKCRWAVRLVGKATDSCPA